jgi:hypothetical protein
MGIASVILMLFLSVTSQQQGNVKMSCSSEGPSPEISNYCPHTYHYFRCEVKRSLRQVWSLSGVEMFRVGPGSRPDDFSTNDCFNLFVQDVNSGHDPSQTDYVSYLWFNCSDPIPTSVTCKSDEEEVTIDLKEDEAGCGEQMVNSDREQVELSHSSHETSSSSLNTFCYSPQKYHYFRCEVRGSLRQVWSLSGVEMFRVGPGSRPDDFSTNDCFNLFVQDVNSGHDPSQTDYVSYLWFNCSDPIPTSVTCKSDEEEVTIDLKEDEAGCGEQMVNSDREQVELSHSSHETSSSSLNTFCYSPQKYHYFRCEVRGSLRQVWSLSGVEEFRLGPGSRPGDFSTAEPLNIFVQDVIPSDNPTQTDFVSYLWFNTSNLTPTNVTCGSSEKGGVSFHYDGLCDEETTETGQLNYA